VCQVIRNGRWLAACTWADNLRHAVDVLAKLVQYSDPKEAPLAACVELASHHRGALYGLQQVDKGT
jgi:hypothetical protein